MTRKIAPKPESLWFPLFYTEGMFRGRLWIEHPPEFTPEFGEFMAAEFEQHTWHPIYDSKKVRGTGVVGGWISKPYYVHFSFARPTDGLRFMLHWREHAVSRVPWTELPLDVYA